MCEKKNDKQGTRENGDCCAGKEIFLHSTNGQEIHCVNNSRENDNHSHSKMYLSAMLCGVMTRVVAIPNIFIIINKTLKD